jgi:glycosyltransferase involved in cell wall biosynthesis
LEKDDVLMKNICGVFVGELGWEYLRFQGRFRKYILEKQLEEDIRVFICTSEGRHPLYHDIYNFRGYFSHKWWFYLNSGRFGKYNGFGKENFTDKNMEDLLGWIGEVLKQTYDIYDCEFFYPERLGIDYSVNAEIQYMRRLKPSFDAFQTWYKLKRDYNIDRNDKIIAVFPRLKNDKRNWSKENYVELINKLRESGNFVVVGGASGISYTFNFMQDKIIDLTKFPNCQTLDLLLAALEDCFITIGSQSALPLISLGQGIPTIMFGCEPIRHKNYYNWAKTSCTFIESQGYDISVDEILEYFDDEDLLSYRRNSVTYLENWRMVNPGDKLPNEKRK